MGLGIDSIVVVALLALLVLTALATVLARKLLASAILLACGSAVVAMVLYMADMHLAAVIELAVGAGLVTAVFVSTISLVNPEDEGLSAKNTVASGKKAAASRGASGSRNTQSSGSWLTRYLPLLVILVVLIVVVWVLAPNTPVSLSGLQESTTQQYFWESRTLDILGLALLILAGVLGVAALISQREEK